DGALAGIEAVQPRRVLGHHRYQPLEGEAPALGLGEHEQAIVLDAGVTGVRDATTPPASLDVLPRHRGVVAAHDVYVAASEVMPERLAVLRRLDGGHEAPEWAQLRQVFAGKEEV